MRHRGASIIHGEICHAIIKESTACALFHQGALDHPLLLLSWYPTWFVAQYLLNRDYVDSQRSIFQDLHYTLKPFATWICKIAHFLLWVWPKEKDKCWNWPDISAYCVYMIHLGSIRDKFLSCFDVLYCCLAAAPFFGKLSACVYMQAERYIDKNRIFPEVPYTMMESVMSTAIKNHQEIFFLPTSICIEAIKTWYHHWQRDFMAIAIVSLSNCIINHCVAIHWWCRIK